MSSIDDEYAERAWGRYVDLMAQRPECFNNPDPDGIVILTDPDEVRAAEAEVAARMARNGFPTGWCRAGVYYEDPWILVTRDVVRFPTGEAGTFHHIIMRGGLDGVAILPVYQDKIVLLRHFRNGLRDWSIEIPRGAPTGDMTPEENAADEIGTELGGTISRLEYMGPMHNNNGMVGETMRIYFAELSSVGEPNLEEGIGETLLVTPEACEEMITEGRISDAHTIVGFYLARAKGQLP